MHATFTQHSIRGPRGFRQEKEKASKLEKRK